MKLKRSSVTSSNGVKSVTPALFTTMVTGPKAARSLATAACTWPRSDTSAPSARAWPPSASTALTVPAQRSSSRSRTPTAMPSWASRLAQAAPMPAAAPVTRATLVVVIRSSLPVAADGLVLDAPSGRRADQDIAVGDVGDPALVQRDQRLGARDHL